jgi:hypothetical protein
VRWNEIEEHYHVRSNESWFANSKFENNLKSNFKQVGQITNSYGTYPLYLHEDFYFVMDDNQEILGFFRIKHLENNIYQSFGTERKKNILESKDIPMLILKFFIEALNYEIVSGISMTDDGQDFWERLIAKNIFKIEIFDMYNRKKYELNQVGSYEPIDNCKIKDPKDDDLPIDIDKNGNRVSRSGKGPSIRFFWIVSKQ